MKARFLVTGIVLFICCAEFHLAEGNTRVQGELQKKAEVVAKEQTPEKALEKPAEKAEETDDSKPKKRWSFKVGADLTNYFVSESSAFFSDGARHWLETSLRLDGTASFKNFTAGISGLGIKTTGLDSFGTGTSTGGSLANEVSFISEWYPRDNVWFNVSLGHSRPGDALAPSELGNPFAFLNSGAGGNKKFI